MKNIDNSLYPGGDSDYKFQMMKRQWLANGQSGLYNDDIKWLFVEVERLRKETEKLSNEISMSYEYVDGLKCCGNCIYWDRFNWCARIDGNEIRMLRRECCLEWKWLKENNPETNLLDSPF